MCWFPRPVRAGRNPVRHNIRRSVGGDFADGGGLPFTVTLSTGDSFDLSTPLNPGLDTGFIGFVSDTPITSIRFSNDGVGFDVLQVVSSSAGAAGVPEPAPLGLMATGLLALALLSRRRAVKVEIGQQLKTDS